MTLTLQLRFSQTLNNTALSQQLWEELEQHSLKEQEKTMNLNKFKENIVYAKQSGFKEFYFWGTEWWYWLKEKQNKPEIWNEAKKLFQNY